MAIITGTNNQLTGTAGKDLIIGNAGADIIAVTATWCTGIGTGTSMPA